MLRYDYKDFSAALAKKVKALRKERNLTQRDFVAKFGFHLNQLHRMENGEGLSVPSLLKLCEALQVPLETLVEGLGQKREAESRAKSAKKPAKKSDK